MDPDEKRIYDILGKDNKLSEHNAERYRQYLLKHLPMPILVTGSEDFPWEEPYVFGAMDQEEYKKLKKTNPSSSDTFEIQGLEPPDENEDVIARVQRLSDGRTFNIGLSWLVCEDEESKAFTLLEDYGEWHTNY